MSKIQRHIYQWGPALLWMAAIFWFSSRPNLPGLPNSLADLILKKGLHMTAYAILAWLLHRSLRMQGLTPRQALLGAIIIAMCYAGSDEWHQYFVPHRHGQAMDVLIDSVGITTTALLLHFHWRPQRWRFRRLPPAQ